MIARLLLVLMLGSSNAMAWEKIPSPGSDGLYGNSTKTTKIYKLSRHHIEWAMHDYKEPQVTVKGVLYRSEKRQLKFDCVNERMGQLYSILYSGQRGLGEEVAKFVYNTEYRIPVELGLGNLVARLIYNAKFTWIPVAPGTVNEAIWKHLCV